MKIITHFIVIIFSLINDENQALRFLLMITLFRQFPKHIYTLVIETFRSKTLIKIFYSY